MSFREIAPKEIRGNIMQMIADEWMLVAAGGPEKFNMMTASWGFAGEMWGKECVQVMIRPQRYTYEFIEREDYFTVSFYGDQKDIHKICGSKSGRDTDKAAEAGLTPIFADGTVYFEQARLVLVCKKVYTQDIRGENFIDPSCLKWYPDKDYHRMYVGEIIRVLEKTE